MRFTDKKIMIIMEDQSYLSQSIEHGFDEQFNNTNIKAEVVTVSDASKQVSGGRVYGYIVFTGQELLKKAVGIKIIVDQAVKEHIPVFVIGNKEELELLWETLPKQMVMDSFIRPIKVPELVKNIASQLDVFYNAKKRTILCIDDSGVLLRKMKVLLEDKYEVVLANSGAMAIKYLTLRCPDLILLDYEMPIVNGGQVMQMLRDDNEFKDIPIIFLTGKNDLATVQNIVNLKPDGYILKSKEPYELHKTIDDFFAQREKKSERE